MEVDIGQQREFMFAIFVEQCKAIRYGLFQISWKRGVSPTILDQKAFNFLVTFMVCGCRRPR